ncbi:MAG: thrombospondin type 3 repeat-containing protein [Bacteroidia bacterium]
MNIKITINKLFVCLFALFISNSLNAQDKSKDKQDKDATKDEEVVKHKPSIMLGVNGMKYFGYVGSHSNLNPLLDARMGYFLAVEQRFGKVIGLELGGTYGKLAGTDNQTNGSGNSISTFTTNFQSQIMQGQLMVTFNFDGVMKGDPAVSPFIKFGIGYMAVNTSTDLKDANGNLYVYQKDGSLTYANTVTTGTPAVTTTTYPPTHRDYKYESSMPNAASGSLIIPAMAGLDFTFGKHMTFLVGVGYTYCLSNSIDGSGKGTAGYLSGNFGLKYEFGKKTDAIDKQYENVDFSSVDHMDADKDGVPDDKDMCHGTPKGVKVDEKGCPLDSDGDGVPDYLDKEPNTAKGNKVDGFGVTVDEKALAQHQKDWENQAPERSKQFNVLPSKAYLEKMEADARKANKGQKNLPKIPANLKAADTNNDGFISVDEITKATNAFFDGSGDFTIDQLNQLIDYFFEQ